ncbi:uncharacterized protein K452DRAFT_238184 [Neofusicoccum parvum]|uniref:Uncharacterized protein K452DRAFT_238184 n=1 Tax=Neofusicoccum parvum TaxID=310453 RepID=A0ACB5SBH1_9PEZI|nr:uncharacterized protein K452DRAFT_238184 [Neofusicoccum parvum]
MILIAGRIVQGIGGGGVSIITRLVISDLVSVRKRVKYMGIVFAVFSAGTTISPVIGGVIIGNPILVSSVIAILIALSWADTRYPWSSWRIILPLVLGFVGTTMFPVFEASKFYTLVPTFSQSVLTYWRIYFLPVYSQAVRLVSPERPGVLPTVPVGVPVTVIAGNLLTRFGRYRPLHLLGFATMTLAAGLYARLDASSSLAEVVVFQMIAGPGTGCVLTTLLPAVQAGLAQANVATATSTWGFIRSYSGIWDIAIRDIAIPAAIFNSRFATLLHRV